MSKTRDILALLMVLAICLPAALVHLDRTEPARIMENLSIASSQETWMRLHQGEERAWIVPTYNGRPRIHKPPLLVWVNLLAWQGLTPENADLMRLVGRARLVGVGFAFLALLGVYWAGRVLADRRHALLAALATGTTFLFIRQARYATYDIHLLGWLTLGVAAGLTALRPGRDDPPPPRARWGWPLAGLFLGAAWLSKGPLALVLGFGPLALLAALAPPGRRRRAAAGLGLAALVALAVSGPWYAYVLAHVPGAGGRMLIEYEAQRDAFQPPWYYLGLLGLVFPWTFALLGAALRLPFHRGVSGRWSPSPAWAWFLFIFVFLSLPMAKQQRYIMPILPAAGLVVAAAWLAPRPDRFPRLKRALVTAHWSVLLLVSLLFPAFVLLQARLVALEWIDGPQIPGVPAAVALAVGAGLVGLALAGWRYHRRGRVFAAAVFTALWMALLATAGFYGYALSDHGRFAWRADVERVDRLVGDVPLYYLDLGRAVDVAPSKEFLMYTRRIIPARDAAAVCAELDRGRPFYLAARIGRGDDQPPLDSRLRVLFRFRDGEKYARRRNEWILCAAPGAAAP